MKINRTTLSLIIASLCGTCASATAVGQDGTVSNTGRIGDQNTSGFVESSSRISDVSPGGNTPSHQFSPVMFHSPSFNMPGSAPEANGVATTTTSVSYGPVTPIGTAANSWIEAETLLWWGKGMSGTPLIVGGPAGVIPNDVLGGGPDNPVGSDLRVGYRFTAGTWLDCDQNYGVMGRVFGLYGANDTTSFSGPERTGLRFFDTNPDVNNLNTYFVHDTVPGSGVNIGNITVTNELDFVAADVSMRTRLLGDGLSRGDLLAGYTFLRLDSAYGLQTRIEDGILGNGIPDGTVTTTNDLFGTRNEFHGGHLGFMNEVASGRFSLSLLGKIAMGNMRSTSTVEGSFSEIQPAPAAPLFEQRGFFAQSTNGANQGPVTRNRFTFVPEVGAKLKYQIGRGQASVGYSMVMLPSVVLAASQIDTNVSSLHLAPNGFDVPRTPLPRFELDSYFLHGLDLGYTFNF